VDGVPAAVSAAGPIANHVYIEYFTARLRNPRTRRNYLQAAKRFCAWLDAHEMKVTTVKPVDVAAYVEQLIAEVAPATVNLHLSAIRELFSYLTINGVIAFSPASVVKGIKHVVRTGKTPVLSAEQTRRLFYSIDCSTLSGLRDRAIIATMVYTFARVQAVLSLEVKDYFVMRNQMWLRLHKKGGKEHDVPVHPLLSEYLDAWLVAANITEGPLFHSAQKYGGGQHEHLSTRKGVRSHGSAPLWSMIKRRCEAAALPMSTSCHSFRATGITTFIENGGSLEHARYIANHASTVTTKLYDRTQDTVSAQEMERIRI
jgi:site-specific recombinase XerD